MRERANFLFVLKEILPDTGLVKTLNSAHEAMWLVLIWLYPLKIRQSNLFPRVDPGWVIDTTSFKSRGSNRIPGSPAPRPVPAAILPRAARGGRARCPFQPQQERTPTCGAQTGSCGPGEARGGGVGGNTAPSRKADVASSRMRGHTTCGAHLQPQQTNFPPLLSWKKRVPYATPWPEPATSRSSEGSSPDTLKRPTWCVSGRRPSSTSRHGGVCGVEDWGASWGLGICGESGRTPLTSLCNSSSQLCQPPSRCPPVPPRRAPGSLGFSNPPLGRELPKAGGTPRARRTYSRSGVSAGTAAPRGASCAVPGARTRRAPRGSPRWPGSPLRAQPAR